MKPPIDLSGFSSAQKDELIVKLFEQVNLLQQQVQELTSRLETNSRNSSKPPSTDNYDKPKPKSRRGKSGKRSGGQSGHKGQTLERVAEPDHIVLHDIEQCAKCGAGLSGCLVQSVERRQVFDLPPMSLQVTEHQVGVKACPCC